MEKLQYGILLSSAVVLLLGRSCMTLQCSPFQASEYVSMSFLPNNSLFDTSINGIVTGGTKKPFIVGDGITLGSPGSVELLQLTTSMCFRNPSMCPNGLTLSIIIRFDHTSSSLNLLSSGAINNYGIDLLYASSSLKATLSTLVNSGSDTQHKWETSVAISTTQDYYITITFDGTTLTLYAMYVDSSNTIQVLSQSTTSTQTTGIFGPVLEKYYIGRLSSTYGPGDYDDMLFWAEVKSVNFIKSVVTSQNSTQCIVSCTSNEGNNTHLSCYACNLFWDCSTNNLYVCMHGFVFNDITKQCEATSPTCPSMLIPVANNTLDCFPTPCASGPCQNNGTCSNLDDGWLCQCNVTAVGWTGNQCETNIDECAVSLNKCVWNNTENCTDGIGGLNNYTCQCKTGYNLTDCSNYDNCLSTPCKNGGSCTDDIPADNYTCSCVPGFVGYNCETNFDECGSNPCQNGGTCNDQVNQYNCTCPPGYSGVHCELYDDCFYNPCVNGTCSDSNQTIFNDYVCTCISGFYGRNCSQENECITQNVTCLNGATCQDQVGGWKCNCVPGYDGTYCGNNINECSPDPCNHGGNCTDLINDYNCTCVPGYVDKNCSTNFDECSSNPCLNSATCMDLVNAFQCNCTNGYSGTQCELYDECSATPCNNGATCNDPGYNVTDDYTCNCATGFYGRNCGDENRCVSNSIVCQNGGNCQNTTVAGGYNCQCVLGFNGTLCSNNIDDCASNPCHNGGTCNDQVNNYNCTCPQEYYGTRCENVNECVPSPCKNGATCTDQVNDYNCTCAGNYAGKNCTQCETGFSGSQCSVEDKCITQNVMCQNSGVCQTLPGSYLCNCSAGYKGTYCNITDECILNNNPCQNGGNCTDLTNDYSCTCVSGFSGKSCTVENKCTTQNVNCLNGGTCSPSDGSCSCTTNWAGATCQLDNPCYPNPCQNNGGCSLLSGGSSYQCSCASGYSGTNCETTPCTSVQCQNNGTCVVKNGQKNCICDTQYSGEFCQTEAPTAGASVGEASNNWKGATIALVVMIIIILVAIVIVAAIIGYKYTNRNNKVNPESQDPESHEPEEEDPIAAILANNHPEESGEGPSNETAAATFDGGDGTIISSAPSSGEMIPMNHRPKPSSGTIGKTRELEGPVVGGTPPPGYEGPTPVES